MEANEVRKLLGPLQMNSLTKKLMKWVIRYANNRSVDATLNLE